MTPTRVTSVLFTVFIILLDGTGIRSMCTASPVLYNSYHTIICQLLSFNTIQTSSHAQKNRNLPPNSNISNRNASPNTQNRAVSVKKGADVPTDKYVYIKTGPASVRKEISPDSPILGMANRGKHYPLIKAGDSWCKILYNEKTGWIERRYIDIVDAPSSSIVFREFFIAISVAGAIIILLFILYFIGRRSNKVKAEWFSTIKMAKKMLIVARSESQVQRYLTNNTTSLEKCFTEIGFQVKKSHDSNTAMNMIFKYSPDAIVVDWQLGSNTQMIIEQILSSKSNAINIFVIFYNLPDPTAVQKSRVIPNVYYLGLSVTDRELFHIVTPLLITSEKGQDIRKSVETSALQGDIRSGNISEVMQFIEIGSKTGCLLIEDEKPIGIIYFKDGIIIYAATKSSTGKKSIFEILGLEYGQFHFVMGREPKSSNCTIPILGILMEWTQKSDEASRNRLRQT